MKNNGFYLTYSSSIFIGEKKMNEAQTSENKHGEEQLENFCALIDSVIKVIKKPRRIQIIKVISDENTPLTFKEIQKETNISTGSLYKHLDTLYMSGVISKTNERPTKFDLTNFTKELLNLKK
jgi:DNA-binding HxlR family transcriptional regulator